MYLASLEFYCHHTEDMGGKDSLPTMVNILYYGKCIVYHAYILIFVLFLFALVFLQGLVLSSQYSEDVFTSCLHNIESWLSWKRNYYWLLSQYHSTICGETELQLDEFLWSFFTRVSENMQHAKGLISMHSTVIGLISMHSTVIGLISMHFTV